MHVVGYTTLVAAAAPFFHPQARLFCACGALPAVSGFCLPCYQRHRHSLRRFGGNRETVLARDHAECRGCGSRRFLQVHHRRPGQHASQHLVTLCAACHATIHRRRSAGSWLPPRLRALWQEWRRGLPEQLPLFDPTNWGWQTR